MQAFDSVLAIAFGSMLGVYALVAGLGYYYFGRDAATLVTSDLATDTPFAGKAILIPGLTVANFMAGCVLLNAYTTYPSLLLVIQARPCVPMQSTRCKGPPNRTRMTLDFAASLSARVAACSCPSSCYECKQMRQQWYLHQAAWLGGCKWGCTCRTCCGACSRIRGIA